MIDRLSGMEAYGPPLPTQAGCVLAFDMTPAGLVVCTEGGPYVLHDGRWEKLGLEGGE